MTMQPALSISHLKHMQITLLLMTPTLLAAPVDANGFDTTLLPPSFLVGLYPSLSEIFEYDNIKTTHYYIINRSLFLSIVHYHRTILITQDNSIDRCSMQRQRAVILAHAADDEIIVTL